MRRVQRDECPMALLSVQAQPVHYPARWNHLADKDFHQLRSLVLRAQLKAIPLLRQKVIHTLFAKAWNAAA